MSDAPVVVQWFYCTTHHSPEIEPASGFCLHVGPFASSVEASIWASGVQKYQTPVDAEPAVPVEPERRVITQDELDEAIRITQAMPMPEFWAAAERIGLRKKRRRRGWWDLR